MTIKKYSDSCDRLSHNRFYTDDFLHSYNKLLEAQLLAKTLKMAHYKGGFTLTKTQSTTTDLPGFLGEPEN